MGFRKFEDIVGRSDLITLRNDVGHWKTKNLDFSAILKVPEKNAKADRRNTIRQEHKIQSVLDLDLIQLAQPALERQEPVRFSKMIRNTDRTVGAMLSGRIAEKFGAEGLPDGTIKAGFKGSAGQSFGAFLVKGVEFKLEGDANDYLGKGLSGGRIVVVPPKGSVFSPEDNIIIGNTVLYGATSGEIYVNGEAGERFCVRNSGASAVVEGVGDHGCEYMTGGRTVVLGRTGKNFAAGMRGGVAYVLNLDGNFDYFCNMGMVELSLVEDRADVRELKDLISRHHKYTGSPRAEKILDDWENYIDRFIKVIPYEYKRVLEEEKLEIIRRKIDEMETDVEIKAV